VALPKSRAATTPPSRADLGVTTIENPFDPGVEGADQVESG
jgi:hypothetical protein